jgi:hypothetical protein
MFFGPMMMLLLMLAFIAAIFFMMRMGPMQRSKIGPCGFGFGHVDHHLDLPNDGHSAFEEYREEALRRLDDEQSEFQEFISHLRKAKDKAEFDQFVAERRNRPSQS